MLNFKKFFENLNNVISQENKIIPYKLTLYRGFYGNLEDLKQDNNYYYFSPEGGQQGFLWFTHLFINHYNPIEYAKNHGIWLLKYPLMVKKHIEINTQENGEQFNSIPDYFHNMVNPTANNRFYSGIELPEGWFFSYKMEKFIVCEKEIKAKKSWVSEIEHTED
jgi:hypothetical protein